MTVSATTIEGVTAPSPAPTYIDPTARVDLMPPEIVAMRQLRGVQRRLVLLGVLVIVAVLGAMMWFRLQESRIADQLEAEVSRAAELRAGQEQYAELPRIQAQSAVIDQILREQMVDDVSWGPLLAELATPAIGEIELTGVEAVVTGVATEVAVETETGGSGTLDASTAEHIAVLKITGQAPSHDAVAAWVASLAEVDGFRVPYLLGSRVVTEGGAAIEFVVEVTLDSTRRTVRYVADPAALEQPAVEGEGG